jgi:hypothetical protein
MKITSIRFASDITTPTRGMSTYVGANECHIVMRSDGVILVDPHKQDRGTFVPWAQVREMMVELDEQKKGGK